MTDKAELIERLRAAKHALYGGREPDWDAGSKAIEDAISALSSLPPSGVRGLTALADQLEFNGIHFIAEDDKDDALRTLEIARTFMMGAADQLRTAIARPEPTLAAALSKEEKAHEHTIDQRDKAEEWADKLAHAIGGDEIGEHTSHNNPWANALEIAEDRNRAALEAASPLPTLPVPEAPLAWFYTFEDGSTGAREIDTVSSRNGKKVISKVPLYATPPVHVPEGEMIAALKEAEAFIARMSGGGETEFRAKLRAALARSPLAEEGALAAFAKDIIRLSWEGCDGGDDIQETAIKHGLLKQVKFDPEQHSDPTGATEKGDSWFIFDGPLVSPSPTGGGQ